MNSKIRIRNWQNIRNLQNTSCTESRHIIEWEKRREDNIRQRMIGKEGERGAAWWIGNIFVLKFITLSPSLSHSLTPSLLLSLTLSLRPISHLSISYFLSLSLSLSIYPQISCKTLYYFRDRTINIILRIPSFLGFLLSLGFICL